MTPSRESGSNPPVAKSTARRRSLGARLARSETAILRLGQVIHALLGLPAVIFLQHGHSLGPRQHVARPRQATGLFQALVKRHRILKNQLERAWPDEPTGDIGRLALRNPVLPANLQYADVTRCPMKTQGNQAPAKAEERLVGHGGQNGTSELVPACDTIPLGLDSGRRSPCQSADAARRVATVLPPTKESSCTSTC